MDESTCKVLLSYRRERCDSALMRLLFANARLLQDPWSIAAMTAQRCDTRC